MAPRGYRGWRGIGAVVPAQVTGTAVPSASASGGGELHRARAQWHSGAMVSVSEFFSAVAVGDVDLVRRFLDEDPTLLANLGPDGASASLTALYNGHAPLADELAARTGELSVFEAAAFDDTARLDELIAADQWVVNSWSADGWQPLHLAAYFGRAEAARILLDAEADVAEPSRNELAVQPLHAAAAGRHAGTGLDPDRLGRPGARPPARRLDPAALGGGQRRPGVGAGAAVGRCRLGGGQRRRPDADRAGLAGDGARGAAGRQRWLRRCRAWSPGPAGNRRRSCWPSSCSGC